jgi:hypothetical protein
MTLNDSERIAELQEAIDAATPKLIRLCELEAAAKATVEAADSGRYAPMAAALVELRRLMKEDGV